MKPKSRLPMFRRLWRAFLVGAVFFAPCGLSFLEFCVGVFAQPQRTKEIYSARAKLATKNRNKVELRDAYTFRLRLSRPVPKCSRCSTLPSTTTLAPVSRGAALFICAEFSSQ